jgi:hypothetical protein
MEKNMEKESVRQYVVSWLGGGDGEVRTCDMQDLRSEIFSLPEDFLEEVGRLEFGQSATVVIVCQAVAIMRIADKISAE